MRQRVHGARCGERHREGAIAGRAWREIRDAFPDISISTIDAFCLSLLHEFPLEAGVDPGFDLADETETPRLVESSLDSALRDRPRPADRRCRRRAACSRNSASSQLRRALAALLDRRLVASDALNAFPARARHARRRGVRAAAPGAAGRAVVAAVAACARLPRDRGPRSRRPSRLLAPRPASG